MQISSPYKPKRKIFFQQLHLCHLLITGITTFIFGGVSLLISDIVFLGLYHFPCLDDLLSKGYAQKVPEEERNRQDWFVWYLPHHPVLHPLKPDKTRVVLDCSAKYRGISLNDKLLQGPDLTNSLVDVLTRFRQEHIAMMVDIESMFHQVRVTLEHCVALRFFWWPEGDLNQDPNDYRMQVHLHVWCDFITQLRKFWITKGSRR